jgi:hypothetical protein
MNAAQLCPANRTAMILRDFGRPVSDEIYRAYDHLIAVRLGMVLMVPVGAVSGALTSMTDLAPCPGWKRQRCWRWNTRRPLICH